VFSVAAHSDGTVGLARTSRAGTGRSACRAGRGTAVVWSYGVLGGPGALGPVSGGACGGPVRGDRRGVCGGRGAGVAPLQLGPCVRLPAIWCRCGGPAAGGAAALAGGDRRDRGLRGRGRSAASTDAGGCAGRGGGRRRGGRGRSRRRWRGSGKGGGGLLGRAGAVAGSG